METYIQCNDISLSHIKRCRQLVELNVGVGVDGSPKRDIPALLIEKLLYKTVIAWFICIFDPTTQHTKVPIPTEVHSWCCTTDVHLYHTRVYFMEL